ncbi:winged helix-turn-helix domain-containing protein [uncultured Azohydromonas sp.]|jgi:DNA-binding winged-HTH domains|uniref:winged helix-turn-helix domain-containing protein n=1 Tax=uncultured Azohydromonas sp. TaxID=487342 RepID=UPI00261B96DA|nr:winged helix-turn-helix domain-containing protein [uncultured Azohydromonas sp.]
MESPLHPMRFAGGSFDPLRGELRVGERQARLRPRSAAVLAVLLEERGRVVGREALMRQVWPDAVVTDDSLAQCIKEIRRALGPAAERIRTLPRVGYAFADAAAGAPAEAAPPSAGAAAVEQALAVPDGEAAAAPVEAAAFPIPLRAARLRWLLGGFVLAVAALVALGLAMRPAVMEPPRFSLAVLPLSSPVNGHERDALAEAIADNLTSDLTGIPGTFVVARGLAERYRGKAQDARHVGRELGVRYVMEGSLHRAGARAWLNLRLVDVQAGEVVWSHRAESLDTNPAALPPALTARVARELQMVLMVDAAGRAGRHPAATPEQLLELVQAQLRGNPGYAPAWMWAAVAHLRLGDAATAVREAGEALRLAGPDDPDTGLLYGVLARARLFSGDARGALEAGEKAMRVPGGNRYAPLVVSAAAMEMGNVDQGRRVMAEFLARNPGWSVAKLKATWPPAGMGSGEWGGKYVALLRAAGLPEG